MSHVLLLTPIFVSHLQRPRHCLLCELNTAPKTCQRKSGAYKTCSPCPQLPRRCIVSNYASLLSISFSPCTKDLLFGPKNKNKKKNLCKFKAKGNNRQTQAYKHFELEINTASWELKGWEKKSSDFYHKVKEKVQKK